MSKNPPQNNSANFRLSKLKQQKDEPHLSRGRLQTAETRTSSFTRGKNDFSSGGGDKVNMLLVYETYNGTQKNFTDENTVSWV